MNAAVFASGSGTNFQALLDREGKEGARWTTRLLIVDRQGIAAVERAERASVPVCHIPVKGRDPTEVGAATLAVLRAAKIEVIFLAGYLRLVPAPHSERASRAAPGLRRGRDVGPSGARGSAALWRPR